MVGIGAIVLLICLSACAGDAGGDAGSDAEGRATFETRDGSVQTSALEIADSDAERARGLMGVEDLQPDGGMVFVFDERQDGSFWMKDTLIPLTIAFWDDRGVVLDIVEMEPCPADPCATYSSRAPYTHALEMNARWFEEHMVEIGDRVGLSLPGS